MKMIKLIALLSVHSSPQSLPPRGLCRKQAGGAREGGCWGSESEEENGGLEKSKAQSPEAVTLRGIEYLLFSADSPASETRSKQVSGARDAEEREWCKRNSSCRVLRQ
jgi:hypothetical protein